MEGIYFYWIAWMAWVYTTFIMEKNKERLGLSLLFLILIILSPLQLTLKTYHLNVVHFVILFISFTLIAKKTMAQKVYLLICSLTITIAYVTFQLFELFDPIWLFLDRKLLLAFVLIYLTLMLTKDRFSRMAILLIGSCQGELLYGFVINKFRFEYEIGSFLFLDVLSIAFFIVFVWLKIELFIHYFDEMIQKNAKGETRINE
ncbi:hypothetical protein [Bacillus sp. PS06]|uniref:YphA family membrane protein n=1 Tax=Bacillus sp. PS06 TaxID=2764176 RepID=UPI00177D3307|nr:hypothetical protein [Bacillus sp. PS06]MBD8070266.1 hypothetical protein [Bacillus sp. PS06]